MFHFSQNSLRKFVLKSVTCFSSTKLEKMAEQVLPGSEEGEGEREEAGGSRGRWPKQCMHIRMKKKEEQEKKNFPYL
jgi:hypothetical protein